MFFLVCFSSCKKYLEVGQPTTQLNSETVFSSDATAIAAQVAIYAQMEANGLFYSMTLLPGLSADELRNHSSAADQIDIYNNNITPTNNRVYTLWTEWYKYIYQSNAMVEGLDRSISISQPVRDQLKGEARFVRALAYFNLVNIFGAVPIARSTNYNENMRASRSSTDSVYQVIVRDLEEAVHLMAPEYKSGNNSNTTERVRPNRAAANALLARVYLFMGRWQEAEAVASEVMNASPGYQLVADLNKVFLKTSPEAILQFMSVLKGFNSFAGGTFIVTSTPSNNSIAPAFMGSFRPGDKRKAAWTGSVTVGANIYYYPFKYKVPQNASAITEYTMILRLAEQILIRAEARAMQNNLSGGEADLNTIRIRAGLPGVTGLTKSMLIDSIQLERKFELAFETGDRWINLKRTMQADAILGLVKGTNWATTDQLYPIPLMEINRNHNLVQNPGY